MVEKLVVVKVGAMVVLKAYKLEVRRVAEKGVELVVYSAEKKEDILQEKNKCYLKRLWDCFPVHSRDLLPNRHYHQYACTHPHYTRTLQMLR